MVVHSSMEWITSIKAREAESFGRDQAFLFVHSVHTVKRSSAPAASDSQFSCQRT